jgi:hypothetical protein
LYGYINFLVDVFPLFDGRGRNITSLCSLVAEVEPEELHADEVELHS